MKNMYWHQKFLPRYIIFGFCIFIILSLCVVEYFLKEKKQPYYQEKIQAASLTFDAFMEAKKFRKDLGIKIDSSIDPIGVGLLGARDSKTTTDPGQLGAKRTSINPNLAALFVQWYGDAGLKSGDTIAMAMTGSFPAADIAALAAAKTMGLKPLIIFSEGASNYGANIPTFSIVDIYHDLVKAGIFDYKPIAVSLGGGEDTAAHMSESGKKALKESIKKSGYDFLEVKGTNDSIAKRIELYKKAADGKHIKAYVNVGGGMASIGLKKLKDPINDVKPKSVPSGVVSSLPVYLAGVNSVAVNFLKQGIPVINMRNLTQTMTEDYHFPYDPKSLALIGEGNIYVAPRYNEMLAFFVLMVDVLALILLGWVSRKYLITYKTK